MIDHFSNIIDYKYTSLLETELDKIADGKLLWNDFLKNIYTDFYKSCDNLKKEKELEKNKHKRILGKFPNTNFDVICYIGKYGPVLQYNNTFSPLGQYKIESITIEQALELLKYPKKLGKYKTKDIVIKKGKFGLYLVYDKKNYSIGESTNEKDITLDFAIELVKPKEHDTVDSNIIKKINDSIIIKTGQYGAYISYNYKNKFHNIKIYNKNPKEITETECMELITKKFKKK